METHKKQYQVVGWAFVFQFVTSFTSMAIFLPLATGVQGSGSPEAIGPVMALVAADSPFVYLNLLGELLTAVGVIFLGASLYRMLRRPHEGLALTAFGLYLVEAALLALGRLVFYAFLVLSQLYMAEGRPVALETPGRLLYETMTYTTTLLNFFFCGGGILFYSLLFKARVVPRFLSLWGLLSLQGVFVGVLMNFWGGNPPLFLFLAYVPYELVLGVWMVFHGSRPEAAGESARKDVLS